LPHGAIPAAGIEAERESGNEDRTGVDMATVENMEPLLITADQVAALLQVSARTVWRLRSAGKLPKPVEVGGSVRWNSEQMRKWIVEGCPVEQPRQNGRGRR
jgi:predicted DNA-binding transcriptional regulator AlpA